MKDKTTHQLFGFPDPILGEHIEAAYQALAINEMRKDFVSFLSVWRNSARLTYCFYFTLGL